MGYYFYYQHENKNFLAHDAEFFESSIISQEASRINVDLEVIQYVGTQPSENTSEHHDEVEHGNVEPSRDIVPIHRFARIPQAPDQYGFYVYAEEHELGDLNEPLNYKVALLDPKFDKWVESVNAEMQSVGETLTKISFMFNVEK
ncbi:hypothetical protein Tco_1151249 [Tanacetum coccineum]